MLKTSLRSVFVLIIILFIIAQFPVSVAEQYGSIQGHVLDKNGMGIAGVSLKLQNGDYKTVATSETGPDGSYAFDMVPSPSGADLYRVIATFDTGSKHYDGGTGFFEVLALRFNTKDIHFNDYPPSGIGRLYGIVASDPNLLATEPATVYLDNGMYFLYPGGRYDTWSFEKLPQGDYVAWAETNIDGVTYTSERKTVHVNTDEQNYYPIYLPVYISGTNTVPYHNQPVPMKNVVHGTVAQKSGVPYAGAKVDLYRLSGSTKVFVASASSNQIGQYLFDNVNVDTISEKFVVRVSVDGNSATQDSDPFTVYYANTLGVQHDINVPVRLDFLDSGNVAIQSVPSGAAISIDGMDIGQTTPCTVPGLLTGPHDIGLSMDGYYNDSFTVQVQTDSTATVNRTLKVSTGSTYLNVMPGDALVYIDGEYAGIGPVSLDKFLAGPHTYTVSCDGYRNESGTFEIVPGESITKEIDMVATPGLSLAFIGYLISSFIHQIFSLF
jgi:5-hydroxyisourate hydrolase-like protein (transthyretin family)